MLLCRSCTGLPSCLAFSVTSASAAASLFALASPSFPAYCRRGFWPQSIPCSCFVNCACVQLWGVLRRHISTDCLAYSSFITACLVKPSVASIGSLSSSNRSANSRALPNIPTQSITAAALRQRAANYWGSLAQLPHSSVGRGRRAPARRHDRKGPLARLWHQRAVYVFLRIARPPTASFQSELTRQSRLQRIISILAATLDRRRSLWNVDQQVVILLGWAWSSLRVDDPM